MTREDMIAAVDGEITRLEQIRELLAKSHSERFTLPEVPRQAKVTEKRDLSPEARRRIALAQKRRWATQKSAAAAGSN